MLGHLNVRICQNKDCEFVQALLNNLIKNHMDIIKSDEELVAIVLEIKNNVEHKFSTFEDLIQSNICMTQYFTGLNNFWISSSLK